MALPERKLRTLHLFSGAGGGILADLILGHIPVCAVEINDYCRRVLLQRQADGILPRFPIWDDVRTFDGKAWRGRVDIVAGGFPCQDISAAGKGAGIEGERSSLWSDMARIVGEVRPRYVWVENSPMLVGRGLTRVLGDLASLRYDASWDIVVSTVLLRELRIPPVIWATRLAPDPETQAAKFLNVISPHPFQIVSATFDPTLASDDVKIHMPERVSSVGILRDIAKMSRAPLPKFFVGHWSFEPG